MLSYDALKAVSAVVEEGGFARAAQSLHITQSAVSQRIKALEDSLGQLVLARGNPPRLTSVGRELVQHLHNVERLESELAALTPEDNDAVHPLLPIGVNADSIATWFLEALQPFIMAERAHIEMVVEDEDYTLDLFRKGEVAGCVTTKEATIQGAEAEYLGVLHYRLVATPAFRRKHLRDNRNLKDQICNAPCVAFNRKDDLHERFIERVFKVPQASLSGHFVPSTEGYLRTIELGWAWGLVPERLIQTQLKRKRLVELLPGQVEAVKLFWHQWRRRGPLESRLGQAVIENGKRLLER